MDGSAYRPSTVADCKRCLEAADEAAFVRLESELGDDPRQGVQDALARARRRLAAVAGERERVAGLYAFERSLKKQHRALVALGMDEVGRGALAGPLAVGGVVVDPDRAIEGIDDSKRLSPRRREELAAAIKAQALGWAVCFVGAPTIDRLGIAGALRRAFRRTIELFERRGFAVDVVLLDGNPLHLDRREVAIVGGDGRCASIACASIVAKVHRDRLMTKFDRYFPGYDLASSKGYGSRAHRDALARLGLSPIHRKSFCSRIVQPTLF